MSEYYGNRLYPVFLKLENFRVLIIGGSTQAHEKLGDLLHNAPATQITVVALAFSEPLRKLASHYKNVRLELRAFRPDDLDRHGIVFYAAGHQPLSDEILALCRVRNIPVNIAEEPDRSDFHLARIVKKGHLKIAISTNAKSPAISEALRETFEKWLPEELDDTIENFAAIQKKLDGNFSRRVKKLNRLTGWLREDEQAQRERKIRRIATYSLLAFGLMLVGHFIFSYVPWSAVWNDASTWTASIDREFLIMTLAGFAAQLVDGSLGMGYGLISATILLSTGINLAAISGSIHTAEMFASGASGYSHYKFGNVDKKLFRRLVIPGVIGAVLGALALTTFGDTYVDFVKPILAGYILLLAVKYIFLAFRKEHEKKEVKHMGRLAGVGGFLDSFGGGGWGPLVTSTLLRNTDDPRKVIGSVSLTEFFVTLASAFTFFTMIGVNHWRVIVALIIGGLIAAPIAARLAGKLKQRTSFMLIGIIAAIWSIRILWKVVF
ncbi:MAG: TSUP family transporter [Flavobacteriales bacterium]|nr:TSUP family transporter [Flavobacteriales bacterium]